MANFTADSQIGWHFLSGTRIFPKIIAGFSWTPGEMRAIITTGRRFALLPAV
jgi:hypothetical protein